MLIIEAYHLKSDIQGIQFHYCRTYGFCSGFVQTVYCYLFKCFNSHTNKHVIFSSKESLDGYQFSVYPTRICPRNQAEMENRLSALHCTDFNVYMCMPNENFTELLEFCYSSYKISVQSGKRKKEMVV